MQKSIGHKSFDNFSTRYHTKNGTWDLFYPSDIAESHAVLTGVIPIQITSIGLTPALIRRSNELPGMSLSSRGCHLVGRDINKSRRLYGTPKMSLSSQWYYLVLIGDLTWYVEKFRCFGTSQEQDCWIYQLFRKSLYRIAILLYIGLAYMFILVSS